METRLALDSKAKQLNLAFKKKFVHSTDTELKVQGRLNTTNAAATVNTSLNKYFYLGSSVVKPNEAYQPDTRLRVGLGAKASTSSDDVTISLNAKKKMVLNRVQHLTRNRVVLDSYTQAVARVHYDFNPRSETWRGEASACLSHAVLRFTEDQDLRVTAGVRAPLTQHSVGQPEPFLRVQENCWTLNVDRHGGWNVLYDL
ncbi:hypothetical protein ACKKBG_A09295 [Auxenochlorella protothecoides x Auxenochlorella symbiontica]